MSKIVYVHTSPDPELSICIPTLEFVPGSQLDLALTFIRAYVGLEYEVIVADCQGELRGYTSPMNEAMAAARGELLLAMNDDVMLTPGATGTMARELHAEGVQCVTPDQTHCDGPQVFAPYCMMWHAADWQHYGGLDEQFVWWCSDIDLARRMWEEGNLPKRVELPVPIEHNPGTTATGPHQQALIELALRDLDRYRNKWGIDAESDKVRLAVVCGANQDPRLEYLRR